MVSVRSGLGHGIAKIGTSFHRPNNTSAIAIARTVSSISALRLCLFRLAARSALEMIARASAAALRSTARRRSWSRRLERIRQGYLRPSHYVSMPLYAPGFIEPCLPTVSRTMPIGPQWAYEIKHDGFRCICRSLTARSGLNDEAGPATMTSHFLTRSAEDAGTIPTCARRTMPQ